MREERKVKKERNKVIMILDWIWKTFLLSMTFLIFTVLGLGIFGFGPSLKASQKISSEWIIGIENPFFKTFWRYYKEDFAKTFLTSWLYLVLIVAAILNFIYVVPAVKVQSQVLYAIFMILGAFILLLGSIGISSVYYFINIKFFYFYEAIRASFSIVWAKIWGVIIMLSVIGLIAFLSYLTYGIALIFGAGAWILVSTKVAKIMFDKIDFNVAK